MREIKFRAWQVKTKKMFRQGFTTEGAFLCDNPMTYSVSLGKIFNDDIYIPMQYIGKKDKNGKEIYEGDITCRHWDDGSYQNGQIIFENGCFLWEEINKDRFIYPIGINTLNSEVIGNIYKNPELLEK